MTQQDEMIEKLSAENRRLVWALEKANRELRSYQTKFGQLNATKTKP